MTAYLHALSPSGSLVPLICDADGRLYVEGQMALDSLPAGDNHIGSVSTSGFDPAGVVSLSVTTASARVALPATGETVVVRNESTTTAYIALGGATITAATTGFPIDPLTVVTLARTVATETHLAAITASGSTSLTAIAGTGGTDPILPVGMAAAGNVTVANEPSIGALPHANLGAFGDLETTELTPVLHLSFVTGIRTQLLTSAIANSATVDASSGRLRLQSGTNATGSAQAFSSRPVSYRPGQGITARLTALFTAGVASSKQLAGMGNAVDGYYFGYVGAALGIVHRRNSVDTLIAQADWNGDKCDGTGASGFDWNPAMGTPLMIKYPFLGYGNIRFYIQNPATSLWILAHTIRYANTSADVQITNPSLSFYAESINSGATTSQTLLIGSVGVFIDGPRTFLGPQFGTDNSKAGVTTETNILTLRAATTVNGAASRGLVRIRQISLLTDANTGLATFRLTKGATLGGSPSYAPISGSTADAGVTLTSAQSIVSRDTAGTTITGGVVVWNAVLFNDSSGVVDLTNMDIFLAPGETLTVTGTATAAATLAAALNWNEDVQ